jgi:hypothetical protein
VLGRGVGVVVDDERRGVPLAEAFLADTVITGA